MQTHEYHTLQPHRGPSESDSIGFGALGVTEVDADDLPFSEVPADE